MLRKDLLSHFLLGMRVFFPSFLLLASLFFLNGCGKDKEEPQNDIKPVQNVEKPDTTVVEKEDTGGTPEPQLPPGGDLDDLIGEEMFVDGFFTDGTRINWNDYRGKVVLVDFWATWCGPCRSEIPNNRAMYDRYHDAGFEIVAISDDDIDDLIEFEEEHEEPWKSISVALSKENDPGYINPFEYYEVHGIPTMVLVGRDGKIIDAHARGLHLQELLAEIFPDVGPSDDSSNAENSLPPGGDLDDLIGEEMYVDGFFTDGSRINWNDYRGKVVLVDFWATWCGPCRGEIPNNRAMYDRYHDAGFEVVSISLDDDNDQLIEFEEEHKIPWKSISLVLSKQKDPDYIDPTDHYSIRGIPTMILVDRDGKIIDSHARGSHLQELLAKEFPEVEPLPPRGAFENLIGEDVLIEGLTLDGNEIDWPSYRGKVVLIDIMSVQDKKSLFELPNTRALYERYHDAGFDIISFSCDRDLEEVEQFRNENPDPWALSPIRKSMEADKSYITPVNYYRLSGLPTMVLINRDGKILDADARGMHLKELLEKEFPEVEPLESLPNVKKSVERPEPLPPEGTFEEGEKMYVEGVCLDGTELDWSSYRGKVVLVDFWATWCGPCRGEIPNNRALYERYHDAGFDIVSISCDDDLDALREFEEENHDPWKTISSEMTNQSDKDFINMFDFYSVSGIPTMILVDRDGKIIDSDARGWHLKELLEKEFPEVEPLNELPNARDPNAEEEEEEEEPVVEEEESEDHNPDVAPPIVGAGQIGPGSEAGELKTLTVNGIDYNFRWCPPGEFMMGSPEDEEGRDVSEEQHLVKLTRGFWLLETEVTQGMWLSVMGEDPRDDYNCGKGPGYPAYNVSWYDSLDFCLKLSSLSGETIFLPTEAEWEYACRAGTSTPFNFGSELNGEQANCDGSHPYGTSVQGKYIGHAVPVKSYPANAWGLYDMHCNLFEWCFDWFGGDYFTSGQMTDPTGPDPSSGRVIRGGGWHHFAQHCRSAFRQGTDPVCRHNDLGFRIVLVPVIQ